MASKEPHLLSELEIEVMRKEMSMGASAWALPSTLASIDCSGTQMAPMNKRMPKLGLPRSGSRAGWGRS